MSACGCAAGKFTYDSPGAVLNALLDRLRAMNTERIDLSEATGRVLAENVITDRPNPACDVSAMDGYVVH